MDYLTEFPYYKSSKNILTCISRNVWRCFIRLCNMIQGWHCQGQISNLLAKQIIEQHGRCFTRTRYWLPFASTWVDPWCLGWVRVGLLIALDFCAVLFFFVLFVFILCLVYPMLPVSLNCSFLIAFRFSLTFILNIFVKEHVRLLLCIFKKKEIIR